MPALRENSGFLVAKTAFPLLILPKVFTGIQEESEQRKGEVGQAILGKRHFSEASLPHE